MMENPAMIMLIVVIAIVAIIITSLPVIYLKYLVKVNRNEALIRCGAGKNVLIDKATGRKIINNCVKIIGGSLVVFPWQSKVILKLSTINIPLDIKEIITKDGIRVHIKANANVNISSKPELLDVAATLLGGKNQSEIQQEVNEVLQGSLRQIISSMSPEEILESRDKFTQEAQDIAGHDLLKLGMELNYLRIQDVEDYNDYFKSLERAKVEKRKETEQREITDAQKKVEVYTRELRNARKESAINEENAKAEEAVAAQEKDKAVEIARLIRRMEVAQQEESRMIDINKLATERNRLEAEANNSYRVVDAQTAQRVAEIRTQEAIDEARRLEQVGIGEAARILELARARAEEEKLSLLARSEGHEQLANAYSNYTQAALLAILLNNAPELIEKLFGREGVASIFREISTPLGNIDSVNIVDMGKGDGSSASALNRYAETAPNILFNLVTQLKTLGFGDLIANLKLDPSLLKPPVDQRGDARDMDDHDDAGEAA